MRKNQKRTKSTFVRPDYKDTAWGRMLLHEKINDPTITYNINYDNTNIININEIYDVTKSNNIELFKFIENIGV